MLVLIAVGGLPSMATHMRQLGLSATELAVFLCISSLFSVLMSTILSAISDHLYAHKIVCYLFPPPVNLILFLKFAIQLPESFEISCSL